LESIKIKNGKVKNLKLHQKRIDKAFRKLNLGDHPINLKKFLSQIDLPRVGIWKCRITYDSTITKCDIHPYQIKPVKTLKVVSTNDIKYQYKWADRKALEKLFSKKGSYDDIIISENGFIRDSFYANLIFYRKGIWYTPKSPLLKGVQRAKLLKEGKIVAKDIKVEAIRKYKKVRLINAMIGLKDGRAIGIRRVYF